jgi:hypothetical protein
MSSSLFFSDLLNGAMRTDLAPHPGHRRIVALDAYLLDAFNYKTAQLLLPNL